MRVPVILMELAYSSSIRLSRAFLTETLNKSILIELARNLHLFVLDERS